MRKEGHGRIRGTEWKRESRRERERERERGTVHGLIRGAINNLGPDIWTWRPTECLSVFSAGCAWCLNTCHQFMCSPPPPPPRPVQLSCWVSLQLVNSLSLSLFRYICTRRERKWHIKNRFFISCQGRGMNTQTDLAPQYDVNTQPLIAHADNQHQSPTLRNISVTFCWHWNTNSARGSATGLLRTVPVEPFWAHGRKKNRNIVIHSIWVVVVTDYLDYQDYTTRLKYDYNYNQPGLHFKKSLNYGHFKRMKLFSW